MFSTALEIAKVFEDAASHGSVTLDQYWSLKLGVSPESSDLSLAVSALQMKMEKLIDVISTADLSDRAKNLYMNAANELKVFFYVTRLSNYGTKQIAEKRQLIDILFLAADALPGDSMPEINQITIDVIVTELCELIDDIENSEIDGNLKNQILSNLNTLLMAVRCYKLLGPDGASRVYGAACAEIARINIDTPDIKLPEKSAIKKALEVAKKVGTALVWVAGVVSAANGIITDGSDILGLSTSSSSEATGASGGK